MIISEITGQDSVVKSPKRVGKLPISMLRQEEDRDWAAEDEARRLVPAASYDGDGDNDDDDEAPTNKRRKIVDRVNPKDYPHLANFVRQKHLEKNWTVIGNKNAAKLEKQWIEIIDKQMDLATAKMDVVANILHLIQEDKVDSGVRFL